MKPCTTTSKVRLSYKELTGDHNHSKNFAYRRVLFLKTEMIEYVLKAERERTSLFGFKLATQVFLAPGRKGRY